MPGAACPPDVAISAVTSFEISSSADLPHLRQRLHTCGLTTLADRLARCCPTFRVLTCANGHVYRPIPAERCRHRLCPHCARRRPQCAVTRLWPAIQTRCRRDPVNRLRRAGRHGHASPDGSERVRAAAGTHGVVWAADRLVEPGGRACRRNPTTPDRCRAGSP
jgi:hypothetical protein